MKNENCKVDDCQQRDFRFEIAKLRALLAYARVELTNVKGSEDTVARIDEALTGRLGQDEQT